MFFMASLHEYNVLIMYYICIVFLNYLSYG
nr:MAG TPA: hypothetical protein [Caudoviricetes sp.]